MGKKMTVALSLMLLTVASVNSQVRIGGLNDPHESAVLDLNASDGQNNGNLGLALPRVALEATNVFHPPFSVKPLEGTLVHNTATTKDVTPGLYYYCSDVWVRLNSVDVGAGIITTVPVTKGGTGLITVDKNYVLLGNGTSAMVPTATSTVGRAVLNAANNTAVSNLKASSATVADALTSSGTVALSGDVSATAKTYTSGGNVSLSTTLAATGVSVGTYTKVSVDSKGRVTSGSNPTTLAGYGITDGASLPSSVAKNLVFAGPATASGKPSFRSLVTSDLSDSSVTSAKIADGTITASDIASETITTTEIKNGTIKAEDLSSMNASQGQLLMFNGTAWQPVSYQPTTTMTSITDASTATGSVKSGAYSTVYTWTTLTPGIYSLRVRMNGNGTAKFILQSSVAFGTSIQFEVNSIAIDKNYGGDGTAEIMFNYVYTGSLYLKAMCTGGCPTSIFNLRLYRL
ncbi:MAG: hypothetical protein EZS26_001907 [Candidatus Ordinivivax streblomastigis]|uniref:Uncharacterized protein n=1 Tax=Candidatus Ordinivivax streblomastigis TaxID=2540710 RepID=A0A5M8P0H9_9BACT|nr:MAG: hypothetical protein EZS26_001907 [Candidatus Ordinivivax streblomastigis]